MKVASLEQSVERYVRKSTMAFLEGEQDLKWITGVLLKSGRNKDGTVPILSSLRGYGDQARFGALFQWVDSVDW